MKHYIEIDEVIGVLNERKDVRGDELCALHDLAMLSTDIPLARLRELAKAEAEGRVVVLPCKVGKTVFMRTTQRDNFDGTDYSTVIDVPFRMELVPLIGETVFFTKAAALAEKGE